LDSPTGSLHESVFDSAWRLTKSTARTNSRGSSPSISRLSIHSTGMTSALSLLNRVFNHPSIEAVAAAVATQGESQAALYGVAGAAKALVIAGLAHQLSRPVIVLTADNETAESLGKSTATFFEWLGESNPAPVATLPFFDVTPFEARSPHPEISERRAITLWHAAEGRTRVLFAPSSAAYGRFRPRSYYRSLALKLTVGDELTPDDLTDHMAGVGYELHEPVDDVGCYSMRGGIVDVFSPQAEWPVRIEFSGDEIDSLREFDPATQRSRRGIENTLVLPIAENRISSGFFRNLVQVLGQRCGKGRGAEREPDWAPEYSNIFPGWEFFAPLAEPHPKDLFSLLENPIVVFDEPSVLRKQTKALREAWATGFEEIRDMVPPRPQVQDLLHTDEEFDRAVQQFPGLSLQELEIETDELAGHNGWQSTPAGARLTLRTQPAPNFNGSLNAWIEDLRARRERKEEVVIAVSSAGKVERLSETLHEHSVPFTVTPSAHGDSEIEEATGTAEPVRIIRGALNQGITFPDSDLTILGEDNVFGAAWGAAPPREKSAASRFISDLSDLKPGDYVVHVDHGIGLYQGLRQIDVEGQRRDFMLLTYQNDAKLYVPLERLDLVEKYRSGTGQDGPRPVLDRLGGTSWVRTKARVKRALRDMAEELLRIYAERKMSGGTAFSADTPWQKEFEEAFDYEETPDQLKALEDIKADLESPQPMDRLLCGDVGYGKTELAMRAAFKVVQDGRQVAVLAPTTVLAFQHFNTFQSRMAGFPVRIEMISRFRSPAQQKKVVGETEEGKVDILIGTHRLLSKDVKFHDLGLLIVDEEQRFGVAAKERLKRFKANVDVLTMSATPIPRTLHMSLGGLRDLSVIETPPRGRLAIQTTVAPLTPRLIQSAILHEMERQGQVYFVHNRVDSIFSVAAMIQRLVPTARIGVGHGQMGERELERVMLKFVQYEYDVLVSTSIIENGLDIPRANTLIVNRADRFGLAELYQLRGRVGRSDRRAYAYLLISDEDSLTPIARRRLAALKEFSDLGAGFRLAALDLELRGAGNLLGAEQSGHLNAIGLDLYLKMLEQTVDDLRGVPAKPEVHTALNLGADIKIPDDYIADESQRLRMYKRISSLTSGEARQALETELTDRYGQLPESVHTLLDYAMLKSLAESMLIQSIDRKADEVWIRFHPETSTNAEKVMRFVHGHRDARLRPDGTLRFRASSQQPIPTITSALQELRGPN
jgi:transcription-repair coupling factor (superfamily II helicase)